MLASYVFLALLSLSSLHAVYGEDNETFALKFLNQYQYISPTRSGNHDVKTAIRNYQSYFGLPVSGELDDATLTLMHKSRCGMPDVDESGSRRRRYTTRGKWNKKNLKYYIKYGKDLSSSQQDEIFKSALKFWADKSALTFTKVGNAADADIKISFGSSAHAGTNAESTCAYPFDGQGGVLAHAFYPMDGRAHFDEAERFTHGTSSGVNLLWVATHEIGHSLGLAHSNVQGAVMYPYYTGYVPNMKLHTDDVAGIQHLYGGPSSSGSCVDNNVNCPYWKSYCSYHSYVIAYCKKTCNTC